MYSAASTQRKHAPQPPHRAEPSVLRVSTTRAHEGAGQTRQCSLRASRARMGLSTSTVLAPARLAARLLLRGGLPARRRGPARGGLPARPARLLARRGAVPVATARAARRNAVRVGRDIGGYCSDTQSGNAQPLRVTASCGLLRRGSGRRCGRPPKRALQMVTYRRRCMHYMLTRRGSASTTARDRVNFTLGRNACINTRLLPY